MKVVELETTDEILENWDFFLEGLEKCNEGQRVENQRITANTFFKRLLHTVARPQDERLIFLITTDDDEPLGFSVNYDVSKRFSHRIMCCFIAYNANKEIGVMKRMIEQGEKRARELGFKELQCYSPRFSGSAYSLFEDRFKFQRVAVLYSKTL